MVQAQRTGGMEGIVAADSAITYVDGLKGELRYRGYAIGDLAEKCCFEQVAYLIWHGELPSDGQLADLRQTLRSRRAEKASRLIPLIQALPHAHPLDALRHLVSQDALTHPLAWDNSTEANVAKALEFTAWFPVAVAAYHRLRQGLPSILPNPDLDTARNFLYMLQGEQASTEAVGTFDTSLILHADHELNASTFAARVTIATQSNLHAAVISALGTLSGPRHGGASDRVIRMIEEVGHPERAEEYVHRELTARRRVMGFGHRVYRVPDPRSHHLRRMASTLLEGSELAGWVTILDRLAEVMAREKQLYPNVDLYAAVVNHALGIDPAFYTSVFALSRIVGWTAHAIEQLDGRLIRPIANYVGPGPRSIPPSSSRAA